VAKPEWGTKAYLPSLRSAFYDLRDPIHCPKCGAVHDPQAALKTRRGRAVVPEKVVPKPAGKGKPAIDLVDPESSSRMPTGGRRRRRG